MEQETQKFGTTALLVVALLVGGLGGYAFGTNGNQNEKLADDVPAGMHRMPDGTLMGDSMPMENMTGMDHSAMMVSSEREFVTGMIPHHQEAVDTAKEVLARGGTNDQVVVLANEIIAAQETEIALLKQWHQDWYGQPYVADDSYKPMMRDLSQLSGAELDRTFLEDMIPHHMGAIMMARSVRPYIEHQEISDMADAIMETQQGEIDLMQELLDTRYN